MNPKSELNSILYKSAEQYASGEHTYESMFMSLFSELDKLTRNWNTKDTYTKDEILTILNDIENSIGIGLDCIKKSF